MHVEIRLKQLLAEVGMDRRGIIGELAEYTGFHRRTIEGLYHNRAASLSLELLGKLCDWLQKHGILPDRLPHALFGRGPQQLWEACTSRGVVTLFLGENRAQSPSMQRPLWISRRDTALAFQLIHVLGDPGIVGRRGTTIATQYLPYHFPLDGGGHIDSHQFAQDKVKAQQTYHEVKRRPGAALLIGSVKTNYLVECLVADLFGCTPFQSPSEEHVHPPIYLQYRDTDRQVPSCMAGNDPPPGFHGAGKPGIYYLNDKGQWQAASRIDTGVVLVSYDAGTQDFFLAAFGFRGRTTSALAEPFRQHPDQFWPQDDFVRGRRVGIYLCEFSFPQDFVFDDGQGTLENCWQISSKVLQEYLAI